MVLPLFDRGVRVDLRETTMPLRGVRLASQDGTTVKADLAVSYRITEAAKSVLAASDPVRSLEARAVAGLRSLVEGSSYADLLIRQGWMATELRSQLQEIVAGWGIEVTSLDIQDIRKG